MAMRHMASVSRGQIVTTREISDRYEIPAELLAKVMQKLARSGYIRSFQGVRGGYVLQRDPEVMKVSEIIAAIEGRPSVPIIQCEAELPENCSAYRNCTIRGPLVKLQGVINDALGHMTLREMV
jgi:Rrf2 family protein